MTRVPDSPPSPAKPGSAAPSSPAAPSTPFASTAGSTAIATPADLPLLGDKSGTPPTVRVAFIDDDEDLRRANVQTLKLHGLTVDAHASARSALATLNRDFDGVVVTDIRMPDIDGLQLFQRLRAIDPEIPVILITGHGDIATAVQCMRDGAYDFLAKPYPPDRLVTAVTHAAEKRHLVLENRRLRDAAFAVDADEVPFIGTTPAMQRIKQTLRHIADADVDVLVEGETGTGKEVVATALHRLSRRRHRALVAINCGALPESVIESELFGHEAGAFTGAQKRRIGRIEHASGGTLFLDEIESMPLAVQVKLLRVLESRQITPLGSNEVRSLDLRVVAATKEDLGSPAIRAKFREDLFYRLNVVTIRIPPLRERREDIPLLLAHYLGHASRRFQRDIPDMPADLKRHLLTHDWPGNVRELAHFAERFVLGVLNTSATVPPTQEIAPGTLPEKMERFEAQLIREALAAHQGDVRATIEALGIPRKTFYDKLQRHGIDRQEYTGTPG
ncbi:sigma-54-dependent transcriptional regulator [Achromobacter ruhlandii]|uniref:sigma-54-dependent transcriptional regulator n=1 Tax=Achromobacter ruhlandii TaxID=72557 RepID=UPI0006C05C98|nr:sigma-54 dependent transcriptional regulator [Achromobacter ruhlandii]CUJ17370.1 C4-dicarboxylate transport transcriptional regulatory protein dctD [Achromobacter ruhlandii]CUJ36838.1 C4-dicarboxylate transport transcriptional regulatory protein dctD [Achromobacter ruhlandii]CUK11715.1 C4-dicarboxylate transport transcriptional regulatory protein dctD [Achromobacter ruhlandii]